MASGSGDGKTPDLPRGLIDRRGAPAGKAARLPSLRGPRDLTLGGVPKKVFAPNIPVRKEKCAKEASKDQVDGSQGRHKARDKSPRGRGRGRDGGRGRGRGRGEENLIQIHSLFEQGPSGQRNKGWGNGREDGGDGGGGVGGGGGRRAGGGPRVGSAPRVKLENARQGAGRSSHSLDLLMRDNFIADGPEEDPSMLPVMMPMYASVKSEVKKEEPETTDNIKKEPMDVTDSPSTSISTVCDSPPGGHSTSDILTCAELLQRAVKSEKEELVFIQLPTELPGASGREEESPPTESASKDDITDKDQKKEPVRCSLRDFSEGYLGKLRVRKSGKTELVLGNVVLDVSMGVPASFLQEVVSVRTDEGDRRMTVLGNVKEKMIITPNFEELLKAKAAENT